MNIEQRIRRRVAIQAPPCERFVILHYRDGEPIGLVVDDKPFAIRPLKRARGTRQGDQLVAVVQHLD